MHYGDFKKGNRFYLYARLFLHALQYIHYKFIASVFSVLESMPMSTKIHI